MISLTFASTDLEDDKLIGVGVLRTSFLLSSLLDDALEEVPLFVCLLRDLERDLPVGVGLPGGGGYSPERSDGLNDNELATVLDVDVVERERERERRVLLSN